MPGFFKLSLSCDKAQIINKVIETRLGNVSEGVNAASGQLVHSLL